MSRVIYLISCLQRKYPTLNSPPAKLALSYQTTYLLQPHSISIGKLRRRRNCQYVNFTASPKIALKLAFNESAIDLTLPVEKVLYQLNNELHKALDTIASLKQIQVAPCQKQPWFDEIVKARHKVVQNREQIQHKYPAPDTWKAYKVKRNVYNRFLIYKKRQLITKQVMDSKGDNKKLYKLMAHLSGARADNPLPPHNSDESLANHFADYFITKIEKNQRQLLPGTSLHSRDNRYSNLLKIHPPYYRAGYQLNIQHAN